MMKTPPEVALLLDELGLAIGTHQVEIIDFSQAESCYLHHTKVPAALVGFACVSPAFAQGRFPKFSFIDLIQKRPALDTQEALAVALICGADDVKPPFWGNGTPFGERLWQTIDRYELHAFFERTARSYGSDGDHYQMRPRGFDWTHGDRVELPGGLAKWRADYRVLAPVRQLMVATILQLYKQGEDKYWMVRVPKKWHAAEGVSILQAGGALRDWGALYAMYPGW